MGAWRYCGCGVGYAAPTVYEAVEGRTAPCRNCGTEHGVELSDVAWLLSAQLDKPGATPAPPTADDIRRERERTGLGLVEVRRNLLRAQTLARLAPDDEPNLYVLRDVLRMIVEKEI